MPYNFSVQIMDAIRLTLQKLPENLRVIIMLEEVEAHSHEQIRGFAAYCLGGGCRIGSRSKF